MALSKLHYNQRPRDFTWPGFVDALASLLMVFVFVLMVFVLIQANLAYRLSGKDASLSELTKELSMLGELLSLEREASAVLTSDLLRTKSQLEIIEIENNKLINELSVLTKNLLEKEKENREIIILHDNEKKLFEKTISESSSLILEQKTEISNLNLSIDKIFQTLSKTNEALKEKEKEIKKSKETLIILGKEINEAKQLNSLQKKNILISNNNLLKEKKLTKEKNDELLLLKSSIKSLKSELNRLRILLEEKQKESDTDKIAIQNLGQALNTALANKVQELQNFRSEFLGRLRKILKSRDAITIVGDRFVFQSEVLFEPGQTTIGVSGKEQLSKIANIIKEIINEIPSEIPWVLQIDGHTDNIPVKDYYKDNWELSTERALSVLRLFIAKGVPPERLSATGYGEFQPIALGNNREDRQKNRRIELKITQRVNSDK